MKNKEFDDQHIWTSFKNGDENSFELLFRKFVNPLYNYGSKFTSDKDLIKECIQELYVTLWTRKEFLGDPASLKNYLYKSFRTTIYKRLNNNSKNVSLEESEEYPFHVDYGIDHDLIKSENKQHLTRELEKAMAALTDRQREAIFLKFYEGLSYEEIAAIMDITVKGTYKLMARALAELKTALPPQVKMFLHLLLTKPAFKLLESFCKDY
ncbi:sigma-70 family RNA polymerase sigma factor [Solitalea sp. MAHUQ-68]|uniref:Sigma-70 family RNA polymerase sigma factor n=1 Tax=Solitalea agri TaxID=2953739 RepID=A0A9X2JBX3_9SPHI|nr:sigma-70 family RNA polymerase sigma factor [Solitalea agri]MCO4292448.1 sigma-70 family RNA polymerase sigma factor [Solitalea agri]